MAGSRLTRNKKGKHFLQHDPTGRDAHEPGAKLDGGKVLPSLTLGGFPEALGIFADIATYGATKYTRNGWQSVPDAERRYLDAMLRHLMAYLGGEMTDPESGKPHLGHVLWNVAAVLEVGGIQLGGPTGLVKNGKPWGTLDKSTGYYVVHWLGKRRHVHRLCYELAHGPIPAGKEVDHIDRDKTNNSPDNLRLASRGQNEQNKLPGANNTSGVRGLSWDKRRKRWRGALVLDGKQHGFSSADRDEVVAWIDRTRDLIHTHHPKA